MAKLREHERRMLSTLTLLGGKAETGQIVNESGLSDAAVMRAAMTLKEKGMAQISEKRQTIASLNREGRAYAERGLPERCLMVTLEKLKGKASLETVARESGLEKQKLPIALGWLHRKNWAKLDTEANVLNALTKPAEGDDEKLIVLLAAEGQAVIEDLAPDLQEAFRLLKGRKLLDVEEKTKRTIEITEHGRSAIREQWRARGEVTQLTSELIVTGKWRKARLQEYNVEAATAKTWPGKKHPYLQFVDKVKAKLVNLGFREMTGTAVETCFFNFDALYTPQDHPAREIFDIYFVKRPRYGKIGASRQIVENVKATHEDGWRTGSTGWRYKYSVKEAERLILRGHGTCLSARTLLSRELQVPGKYFSIARCYRPDVVDKTHLPEFNQVEGIVVDEELTLRDLLGILETFAVEIAEAEKVKLKPDYYPFTEPSVELSAYKKGQG